MLFQTAVEQPLEQRRTLLAAAKVFTEMGGMTDMLLGIRNPGAEFVTARDLQAELAEVCATLRTEQAHGPTAEMLP